MFRGSSQARVDEKGRLKLPADFKRLVDELYGPQFYITSRDGVDAEIFPMKEWELIEQAIKVLPGSAAKKKFLDATNYYGAVVDMDAQGRVLIPQKLREKASVTGDVTVMGQQTFLRVVNDAMHEQKLDANPLTDAEIESLNIVGL
jgi:MraZ protein